jgi:hypothetical protein
VRHPARHGPADANQRAISDAIRLLGYPVMDLHAAGNGVEDLLVGVCIPSANPWPSGYWLLVEIKVARNKRGEATPSQFKPAQKAWRKLSAGWPRIVATSAQDAVDQLRALTR